MKDWDLILFFDDGREEKCKFWMPVPETCGKNEKGDVFVIQPAVLRTKGLIGVQRRGEEKMVIE